VAGVVYVVITRYVPLVVEATVLASTGAGFERKLAVEKILASKRFYSCKHGVSCVGGTDFDYCKQRALPDLEARRTFGKLANFGGGGEIRGVGRSIFAIIPLFCTISGLSARFI